MKVIIAPLHWGLGHATRMLPIIQVLLDNGFQVHLASDGEALAVLTDHFPTLPATQLPSYNIQYKHSSLLKNSVHLASNLLQTIPKEKKAIRHLAKAIQADIIISDNRYGCYTDFTKNIFITHQLHILTGHLMDWPVNQVNKYLLKPFDEIWVPDFPDTPNLAGKLAHPPQMDKVSYIGGLSRFRILPPSPIKYDITAILSGPEPQRSLFEAQILTQFKASKLKTAIIRGKPLTSAQNRIKNMTIIDYASTDQLTQILASSHMIISRPGYSSIMDYAAMGLFGQQKKTILFVPTPGQPEQIYLAEKFKQAGITYAVNQNRLDIERDLMLAQKMPRQLQISPNPDLLLQRILGLKAF